MQLEPFSCSQPTLPASSLAAIFRAPGQPMELEPVPLPQNIPPGELIVKVSCCTLCGSDLSTLAGHRQEPAPCILGHEIVGVVAAMAESDIVDLRGRVVRRGDRIVWSVAANCGLCRYCLRGLPQKCVHLKKYGHTQLKGRWQLSGGLAEYCHLVRGTQLIVISDDLADAVAAPASCATATVAAALRKAAHVQGARLLILGAGLLGLTACAMASVEGAEAITICDLSAERLALAQRFGAQHGILWDEFISAVKADFDVILEMSGSVQAVAAALRAADTGAAIVLVGSVRPTPAIELLPEQLVRRLWSLHGVHNYRPDDLVRAVEFLEQQASRFPFAEVASQNYALTDINAALAPKTSAQPIRIAICPYSSA